ncbi:MAG TPA: CDP-diacylglycerol--glycerol-3-phosphate 3-phosphatidyltransferase [Desulfonatronum sp.]|nr:CDP-diacylglycerol--glycerol-3-phosphate 3-phosphatidyltransferase [Desulfonatronum sp.]
MSRPNNWTLPNAITVARIIMVPAFVVAFVNGRHDTALLLFVAAGLSDALDGFLARVLRQRSQLGAMLDPMADKLLLITAYMCLGLGGLVSAWLAVLVISRDVMLIGGMALLHFWGVNIRTRIRPTWLSKFNTCAQIVLVIAVLADLPGRLWQGMTQPLVVVVAAATALSGAHYIYVGLGLFPRGE